MTDRKKDDGTSYGSATAANRMTMWQDCMTKLVAEVNAKTFKTPVSLAASDISTTTTTHTGNTGTWLSTAMNYKNNVGMWETHCYSTYATATGGSLLSTMTNYKNYVTTNAGSNAKYWIYEAGFTDGKVTTTSATNYDTNRNLNGDNGEPSAYTYGVNMADYCLQAALGGVDGVVLWSFDKKMHYNYNGTGGARTGNRDWGLVDSETQTSRPCFYTTALISRTMQSNFKIYKKEAATTRGYRSVYTTDGKRVFAVAVNNRNDATDPDRRFKFPCATTSDKIYVYFAGPNHPVSLDANGKPQPTQVLTANFNSGFWLQIPQGTLAVVSQEPLF
jgi:hypothetical protein